MNHSVEDGGGHSDDAMPTPPSSRVRLEVSLLDDDRTMPAPTLDTTGGEPSCLTVLVVAAEPDFRRYVRECLRERTDLRLIEATTTEDAIAISAHDSPHLLILDEPARDVVRTLTHCRAIVIVEDVPREAHGTPGRIRWLSPPFSAHVLVTEVRRLLH